MFFTLAFALSWICWLLSSVVRPQWPTVGILLFIAGSFGPSIAAIAVVRHVGGQDGLHRWLRRSLQWQVCWSWLALSFFLSLAVMGLAAAGHDRPVSSIRAYASSHGEFWAGAAYCGQRLGAGHSSYGDA